MHEEVKDKAKLRTHLTILGLVLTITAIVTVISIQFFTRTGAFRRDGQIVFDDSMTEVDRNFINNICDNISLSRDVTISAITSSTTIEDTTNSLLYDILIATTNFYDPTISVSEADAAKMDLISIRDLTPDIKLLAIDNNYYLQTLNSGAFFKYFHFESQSRSDLQKVLKVVAANTAVPPTQDTILSFAQTGVTALARGINARYNTTKDASAFASKLSPFLGQFDLIHTSNESSFIKDAPSANASVICSEPDLIDVITDIGFNSIELTGNHNQDCGDQAAKDTIDLYESLGIAVVGGGKTAADAADPLIIQQKYSSITLLAYNLSTGGYTLDGTPGANFYTEAKAKADIEAAKERGDFIIVDVQFNECSEYVNTSEDTACDYADSAAAYPGFGNQITFFRHLIDLGANIVIGTSAHQPQTYELYGNGTIYYGLGNLFFDQSEWPGTTRSLILIHYFYAGKYIQTQIAPTVYNDTYQTQLMEVKNAEQFLKRLIAARPKK